MHNVLRLLWGLSPGPHNPPQPSPGANTGGKSTLLRATCLAVVMAQLGCYVPCSRAELAPVDRIFTRIGGNIRVFST